MLTTSQIADLLSENFPNCNFNVFLSEITDNDRKTTVRVKMYDEKDVFIGAIETDDWGVIIPYLNQEYAQYKESLDLAPVPSPLPFDSVGDTDE